MKIETLGPVLGLSLSSLSIIIGMVKYAWGNDALWFICSGIVCLVISWVVGLAMELSNAS
ncbi:MAG: hypothetical protein COA69_09500 [Robiginitomaculum sp.]|nr:MAG: hypothetical protein COA69_09500 [Robiginitomaculum sp.]